ncbi:MAG: metal ABC transporter substrate-binding protein [Actinobacteria bacterium]|nr:metal ABC transporter substrate-binding protein [Actinomycetota bacterium]
MRSKILWVAMAVVAIAVLGAVVRAALPDGGTPSAADKVRVTASFYPMAEFARQVGGDKVEVSTLISPGVEPHDYDPTPQDIAGVHKSRLFIYNGAGLEPWADKIGGELAAGGVVVVNASDGLDLLTKDGGEDGGSPGGNATFDPHVWLDPVMAGREVDNIKAGLIEADPQNQDYYENNANAYKQQLAGLDGAFRGGLADCGRRDIVTSHQAFKYLAARYGLDVMSISGLSPDEEPSPQKLAEVAQFARDHNVHYIFFETLTSPKLSETIASEVGAQTLVFNPLEGLTKEQISQGMDYLSVQRDNIASLRTALECKN